MRPRCSMGILKRKLRIEFICPLIGWPPDNAFVNNPCTFLCVNHIPAGHFICHTTKASLLSWLELIPEAFWFSLGMHGKVDFGQWLIGDCSYAQLSAMRPHLIAFIADFK